MFRILQVNNPHLNIVYTTVYFLHSLSTCSSVSPIVHHLGLGLFATIIINTTMAIATLFITHQHTVSLNSLVGG